MVNFYLSKLEAKETQLKLAKIGYREEVLKISSQMAKTTKEESEKLMQDINKYADAIMGLEKEINDCRDSLNRAIKARNIKETKEEA